MDKNRSVEEIKQLVENKQFSQALEKLERMDTQAELTESDLAVFAEVYICNKQFAKAKTLLEVMFNNNASKKVISQLFYVCMIRNEFRDAEKYYNEYRKIAPNDKNTYVFRYRLDQAQKKDMYTLIESLEKIQEEEYVDEFAYDLAKLYFDAGYEDKCLKKCNEIMVLSNNKDNVDKATKLKEKCLLELDDNKELGINKEKTSSLGSDMWKQFQQASGAVSKPATSGVSNTARKSANSSIDRMTSYKSNSDKKTRTSSTRKDSSLENIEAKARLSIELNARKALEEKFKELEDKKREAEDKLKKEIIIRKKYEAKLNKSETINQNLEAKIAHEIDEKRSVIKEYEKVLEEKKGVEDKLNITLRDRDNMEKEKDKMISDLEEDKNRVISDLEQQIQMGESAKSQLLDQLDTKNKMIDDLENEVRENEDKLVDLNSELQKNEETIIDLKAKLDAETTNTKVLDERVNGILAEKNELEVKIRQIDQNRRVLQNDLKDSIYNRKLLENKCNQNLDHKRYLENRLAKLEEERNELDNKTREQQSQAIILQDTIRQNEERIKEMERQKVREINDILAKNASEKKLLVERTNADKQALSEKLEREKKELESKLNNTTRELEDKKNEFATNKKILEERIGKSVANNKLLDQNLKSKIDIINSLDARIKAVMNEKKILTEQKKQLEDKLVNQINNNKRLDEIIKKHIEGKKFLEEQLQRGHEHINRLKEKNDQGAEIIKRLEDKVQFEINKSKQIEQKLRESQMKCDMLDKELKQRDRIMKEARDKEINLIEESGEALLGLSDSVDIDAILDANTEETMSPDMVTLPNIETTEAVAEVEDKKDEFDSIYQSISSSISEFLDDDKKEESNAIDIPKNIPNNIPVEISNNNLTLDPLPAISIPDPQIDTPKPTSEIGSFFDNPDVPDYKKAYEDSQSIVSQLFGESGPSNSRGEYNYEPNNAEKQKYYQEVMQSQMLGNYTAGYQNTPSLYTKESLSGEIFAYYFSSPFIMDQIQKAIFNFKSDRINNNFVIVGSQCYNKNELSKMIAKQLFEKNAIATNKIARISGEAFNKVDLDAKASKLVDGCVIIQNAETITNVAFNKLIRLISNYKDRIVVILETEVSENQLFANSQNARSYFGGIIRLPAYSVDFLMDYAKTYLVDNNMGISEEAENTLAGVFNNKLRNRAVFSLMDVCDYLNKTMEAASRRKKSKHPTDIIIRQDINTNW